MATNSVKTKYTAAQRRTIRLCKKNNLSAKVTAEKVNGLKSTIKTGKVVTTTQVRYLLKVCDTWGE